MVVVVVVVVVVVLVVVVVVVTIINRASLKSGTTRESCIQKDWSKIHTKLDISRKFTEDSEVLRNNLNERSLFHNAWLEDGEVF